MHIKVYPNPASDNIIIDYNFSGEILFYDVYGRTNVFNIEGLSGQKIIDIREWNEGLYYYTIIVNNNSIVRNKVLIIR